MIYRRARLESGQWYKATLSRGTDEHARVRRWLKEHLPDENFMCKSVMDNMNILINNEEDFVLARLGVNISDDELRGFRDWDAWMKKREERWWEAYKEMMSRRYDGSLNRGATRVRNSSGCQKSAKMRP